ncbi:MAG: hypothetical protein C0613_05215 [Desulfobulbaceae bacterium]|nr:MAG: hypothetical protein C0613_05215 [Desulfobulbaceae bacterium]
MVLARQLLSLIQGNDFFNTSYQERKCGKLSHKSIFSFFFKGIPMHRIRPGGFRLALLFYCFYKFPIHRK